MKSSDALILAAAAAAAWFIVAKAGKAPKAVAGSTSGGGSAVEGIFNGAGVGDAGYGWRYYTDGTAIDPSGNYYFNGQLVYRAR